MPILCARLFMSLFMALSFVLCIFESRIPAQTSASSLGIFDDQSDVGSVIPPGTLVYSPGTGSYTITAAGINLWSI